MSETRSAERAATPVIGIILLVAVAVVVSVIVLMVSIGLASPLAADPPSAVFESDTEETGTITITHMGGDTIDGDNIEIQNAHGNIPEELSAGTSFTVRPITEDVNQISVVWENQDTSSVLYSRTVDPVPHDISAPPANSPLLLTTERSDETTATFESTFDEPRGETALNYDWTAVDKENNVYQLGRMHLHDWSDLGNTEWIDYTYAYDGEEPEIQDNHVFSYTNTLGSPHDVTIQPVVEDADYNTLGVGVYYPKKDSLSQTSSGNNVQMRNVEPGNTVYVAIVFSPDAWGSGSTDDYTGEFVVTTEPSE